MLFRVGLNGNKRGTMLEAGHLKNGKSWAKPLSSCAVAPSPSPPASGLPILWQVAPSVRSSHNWDKSPSNCWMLSVHAGKTCGAVLGKLLANGQQSPCRMFSLFSAAPRCKWFFFWGIPSCRTICLSPRHPLVNWRLPPLSVGAVDWNPKGLQRQGLWLQLGAKYRSWLEA